MMPIVMPMLMNDWTPNQIAMPDATSMPNWSSALAAIRSARNSSSASSPMMTSSADEADLLAGDREDEVGVLLGHEVAGDELTVEQALAGPAA